NGLRRFFLPQVTRAKLLLGLERAQRGGGTFHLWFHPSNFYYRRDEQLATLAWFLERAADAAGRGRIEFLKMNSYVARDIDTHYPLHGGSHDVIKRNERNRSPRLHACRASNIELNPRRISS